MDNFKTDLAELLEADAVNETDMLEDFEAWDSLTILSIIAYTDENYKVSISAQELTSAKTVGGLRELIDRKIGK
jgi:acyl carrier protein